MHSRRLKYLLGTLIISWVLFIVLRIVFYLLFNDPAAETSENEIKRAFWMGARFDLRLSILLTFPILILSMRLG